MQSTDITVTNVIEGIEKVKGENICILDFTEMENSVCKYFVVDADRANKSSTLVCGRSSAEAVLTTIAVAVVACFRPQWGMPIKPR